MCTLSTFSALSASVRNITSPMGNGAELDASVRFAETISLPFKKRNLGKRDTSCKTDSCA